MIWKRGGILLACLIYGLEGPMQKIRNKTLKDILFYNDIAVFTYKIDYPFFLTTCSTSAARGINAYYAAKAEKLEQYCRTILYDEAVESARYIQKNYPPFRSYELEEVYTVTYNERCITSLYTERYTYMGGAHGATERNSDTWDFRSGRKIALSDFYPGNTDFADHIKDCIEKQTAQRLKAAPSTYFDNYPELIRQNFHLENYYMNPDGIVIYFQQYDIAPYSSGLPEFELHFKEDGRPD